MALTDAGRDQLTSLAISSGTAFDNSNAHIGVGDSTTAFAADQTDLQGSTNKVRKAMDATYPTREDNALTFRATFGTGDANFAWNERGVFNASSSGVMLNRKVESLGTKTSAQSWEITCVLTLDHPEA
jgi:hypothetical protein